MRIETFIGKNKQFYWRIKAANNKILLQSEGYKRRATMLRIIRNFVSDFGYLISQRNITQIIKDCSEIGI
jgi:hypothetical protein